MNYCPPYPTEIERFVENGRSLTLRQRLNHPRKRAVDGRYDGLVQVPGKRSKHIIKSKMLKQPLKSVDFLH